MAVHPKHFRKSIPVTRPNVCCVDIMKADHPLYGSFIAFCDKNTPTKRQASKFLSQYPQLRGAVKAA